MDKVEMLWSGGWDSTYMLCMEARKPIVIRPYYIVFHRPGEKEERAAMSRILKKMKEHKDFKARILPVKYVDQKYIDVPAELREVFYKYRHKYSLGGQYLQLSSFALQHKGIFLGQERYYETPGHLTKLLIEKGNLQFTSDGVGFLPEETADKDVFLLYGSYRFPIALKNELMMMDDAKKYGFIDIMDETWFCYYPKDGKPCGVCLPCVTKYNQHLYHLLSFEAQVRVVTKSKLPVMAGGLNLQSLFEWYCHLQDGYSLNPTFDTDVSINNFILQKKHQDIETYRSYFDEKVIETRKILENKNNLIN